jgi:hypothetical protein
LMVARENAITCNISLDKIYCELTGSLTLG